MTKALLLFSGGQDSTTALAWCLHRFNEVYLIAFDYGQNHLIELSAAKKIVKKINNNFSEWNGKIKNILVYKINKFNEFNKNSLTSDIGIRTDGRLPNTFVPGRNILFYTLASSYAYDKNINHIVSGVCQTDYSGYPDCRNETIKSLEKSINLGMEMQYKFHTPLMWKDKADIWKMAQHLGGQKYLNLVKKNTHTCYKGNRKDYHDWGYGCNNCPACALRSNGWEKFINAVK
jgi:7-cyano-7-deazaguanine synthase